MFTLRPAHERGHARIDWLDSHHTFSFGQYHDPDHMGFASLRVINEDVVAPSGGFAPHPHKDMEIITYVLSGALAHKDSLGSKATMLPGDVQRMSAGTGITHSEYNASDTEPVHLLQIWFLPDTKNIAPGYAQKFFDPASKRGRLKLVASREGREDSIDLQQDVYMYAGLLDGKEQATHTLRAGRHAWVQLARGEVTVNGQALKAGDGLAAEAIPTLEFSNGKNAEVILFDMA